MRRCTVNVTYEPVSWWDDLCLRVQTARQMFTTALRCVFLPSSIEWKTKGEES